MMALAAATALGAIAWSAPPGGAQTAASAGPSTVTSDGQVLPIPSSGKRGESGTFGAATPPPAGTAPAAVGPLTLASADSIIGADNRTKVSDTTKKPARMVALLTYGGNQWCSGFMIGIDTLVTSGHCVFDTATNTFYDVTQFRAYPGYDVAKPNPAPYGSCTARLLVSNSGWTVSHSDEYDYGALKLSCTVGQQTGWFGWWYQTRDARWHPEPQPRLPRRQAAVPVEVHRLHPRVRGQAAVLRERHLRREQRVAGVHQAGERARPSAAGGA